MVADYRHGIRLATSVDDKILITLNARSENDRTKFVEDLKEAVLEVCKLLFNIFYVTWMSSLACHLYSFFCSVSLLHLLIVDCELLEWK